MQDQTRCTTVHIKNMGLCKNAIFHGCAKVIYGMFGNADLLKAQTSTNPKQGLQYINQDRSRVTVVDTWRLTQSYTPGVGVLLVYYVNRYQGLGLFDK